MHNKRPGVLTTLAIIGIILGLLFALGAFWQMVTLALQGPIQQLSEMSMERPGMSEELIEAQRRMNDEIFAVQRAWSPFNWAVAPLSLLLGIALLVGSIFCLKVNPIGRKFLLVVCALGILLAVVKDVGTILMSIQAVEVTEQHMNEMIPDSGDDAEQAEAVMSGVMGISLAITVAFYGSWFLLKVGYFLWGVIYLSRRQMKELFDGPPAPA